MIWMRKMGVHGMKGFLKLPLSMVILMLVITMGFLLSMHVL
jgi:hypothetical protein